MSRPRVALLLAAVAALAVVASFVVIAWQSEPMAPTLPEIGPGAHRVTESGIIGAIPDGGKR